MLKPGCRVWFDKMRQMPEEKSGVEISMKRLKQIISTMLVCGLVLGMSGCAGCGKKEVYQGGEGTNFPYTCEEEGKGTYLIKLDGSYGEKDYRWVAENSDETVVKVEVAKKEKKGKVSYRVTPLADGMAEVRFIRQREVEADAAAEADTTDTAAEVRTNLATTLNRILDQLTNTLLIEYLEWVYLQDLLIEVYRQE